jgi:hypothetical protein
MGEILGNSSQKGCLKVDQRIWSDTRQRRRL